MFLLWRFLGAFAAFGIVSLIALAPSAALAHGGHKHGVAVEAQADLSQSKSQSSGMERRAAQELRAAEIIAPQVQHDHGCTDRGCCGNGHCAGCVTALAPSSFAEFRPRASSLRLTFDTVLPPGLGTSGPPRPPRSFV